MLSLSPELLLFGIGLLLLLTVLAGNLSSRFGLPALIGFLALGMLAGSEGVGGINFENYALAQTIGVVCLVCILFSGGLDTDWNQVKGSTLPAGVLATVGVIISAGIVTLASMLLLKFTAMQGFLLGAVIASTDAAAVFAILRSHGLPLNGRVQGLVELESGSNDPMAIFMVGAALLLMTVPGSSVTALAPAFIIQMLVGAAVGAAMGFGMPALLSRVRLQVGGLALVVSVAAALLSYGLAGILQGNGFLAAYIAGIIAGSSSFPGKRTISLFQDGAAWLAQVVMFLTLGLLVFPTQLLDVVGPGLAITAVLMLIARPLSVFLCLAPFSEFGWREKLFISWAGLRGAVPVVLATFPIVAGVEGAQVIFNIVFFVVLLSSLIQGPTLGLVARRLGIEGAPRP
ncbi:MAG TPA: potassium/proton antiporter [Bosea sp. (in: a-proteobacteria)]|jgi:cell volume regulation protein A|uniref:potassium/proton antiporter n=1 Tax=Bosea sp. (in: a-proteobacteria) TaxID=1871050 RepID=UPI002DDCD133|nr:potassium/proton antiporter [Bosea sp. (in: a-proteobacteria)]HEV2556977.1 potassium/proton antiporter [Bosea sp. (in: a-proteobacteria)]